MHRNFAYSFLVALLAASLASADKPARIDRHGDPLPEGAVARLGNARLRHSWGVLALAFSADGTVLASTGLEGTVCLWRIPSGERLFEWQVKDREHVSLYSVAVSPDGMLVAAVASGSKIETTLHVWNAASGAEKFTRIIKDGQHARPGVGFSPDGKLLVVAGTSISLLDAGTGKEVRRFDDHASPATQVMFSADGKYVASLHEDMTVLQVWLAATGKRLSAIQAPDKRPFHCLAAGPGGQVVVTGHEGGTVWLWDLASAKAVRHFKVSEYHVSSVSFAADGKLLAVGAQRGVALFDPTTGELRRTVLKEQAGFYAWSGNLATVSPDGRWLATANSASVRLWNPATGAERPELAGHPLAVRTCSFSTDGKTMWTSCGEPGYPRGDHVLRAWDVTSGRLVRQVALPDEEWIQAVSGDVRLALTEARNHRGVVHLWRTDGPERLHSLAGHRHGMLRAAFSPDNRLLVVSDSDSGGPTMHGIVHVWDLATGEELHQLAWEEDQSCCWALAFSPGGRLLACGGFGGVWLVDPESGTLLWKSLKQKAFVQSLAFSGDGRLLAAVYEDSLDVYEVESGKEVHSGRTPWRGKSVAFAPDGRTLLVASNDDRPERGRAMVQLLDLATGTTYARLSGHDGQIHGYAFSRDAALLATTSEDKTVLLWDFASRKLPPVARGTRHVRRLWADLAADDAATAHKAFWALAADPGAALPLLKEQVRPIPTPDGELLAKLIRELDDDDFDVRERATDALERLGELATDALRTAAGGKSSAESRRRLMQLLARREPFAASGERLRLLRAVYLLEQIGTADAITALERVAKGAEKSRLTLAADAALARLRAK